MIIYSNGYLHCAGQLLPHSVPWLLELLNFYAEFLISTSALPLQPLHIYFSRHLFSLIRFFVDSRARKLLLFAIEKCTYSEILLVHKLVINKGLYIGEIDTMSIEGCSNLVIIFYFVSF